MGKEQSTYLISKINSRDLKFVFIMRISNEMGVACNTDGGEERSIQGFGGET
jgi:hypothetical protein